MKKQGRIFWLLIALVVACLLNGCASSGEQEGGTSIPVLQEQGNGDSIASSDTTAQSGGWEPSAVSQLCVRFIDVGQADCALLECDGHYMLIDGGNRADSSRVYSVLQSLEVSHLDMVVGTHAHEDHIGGIPGAFQYATADITLSPVTEYTTSTFDNFAQYAQTSGGGLTVPQVGDTYPLGSASVTVLGVNCAEDTNDTSIVMKVVLGDVSFLFTGDAERPAEQVMIDAGVDLSATVLKVGHHGSDSSTTYPFLRQVMPMYGVISVGEDNEYGHPTREVLERLEAAEVDVLRTDELGDIVFYTDGRTIRYVSGKNAASIRAGQQGGEPLHIVGETEPEQQREPDVGKFIPVPAPEPVPAPVTTPEPEVPSIDVSVMEPEPLPDSESEPTLGPEPEADPASKQTNMVWIPRTGKKYHSKAGCSGMKNPSEVTIERAISLGYGPCKRCY